MKRNKSELQQKSKSKQKNVTYRFKSKNEREKEIEEGALLYLKNEEKYKLKNWINTNRSVIAGSKNRNNNNIFIKKKVFKSTDEKKINQNKSDIEPDNYIKLYQLQKSELYVKIDEWMRKNKKLSDKIKQLQKEKEKNKQGLIAQNKESTNLKKERERLKKKNKELIIILIVIVNN